MGTIRNKMTIIHHYNKEEIAKIREYAVAYFQSVCDEEFEDYNVNESMVSPILKSPVNGEYSFVIMGDCSKDGWDISERFEKYRMKWAKEAAVDAQNVVIVNFGEGDAGAFCDDVDCY